MSRQDGVQRWDAEVCLGNAESLLSFVRDNTSDGGRYTLTYEEPFTHVTLRAAEADSVHVLPENYAEMLGGTRSSDGDSRPDKRPRVH
mmetsp:Transcript_57440/g.135198  ORF Transcript_57440/g.135198 Transcript_57440/m.135198 type:complete len:88 (+) Transcript_57440:1-264(+)